MTEEARQGSSRIFISYRREDSIAHVNALFHPLRERFGAGRVFKDTDNIAPGQDFTKVIQNQLKTCSVLLAVIGQDWLTAKKPRSDTRRIDDPNDYLRIEVVTALKDETVLVIPILVGEATMPAPEDLPDELVPLSRRNGFALRDSRWDSDVRLLIHAIEQACGESRESEARSETRAEKVPLSERTGGFERLAARRKHQIEEHVSAARAALDAGQYEEALENCEKALWLEPADAAARELRQRARAALDEGKIGAWLADARRLMSGKALRDADLTAASELIDQALSVDPEHPAANALRDDVLARRRRRVRERDDVRHVRAVLTRAQENLDREDFDACIAQCDDALGIAPESSDARAIRERAVAARDERRRLRERRQRAVQAEVAVSPPVAGAVVAAAPPESQPERQPGSSRMLLVAGSVAAAVLLAGAVAWSLFGSAGSDQPASVAQQTAPAPQPAAAPAPPPDTVAAAQPPAAASKPTAESGTASVPPAIARPEAPVTAPPSASADAAGNKSAPPASRVEPAVRPLGTAAQPPVERTLSQPRPADPGPATEAKKVDMTFARNSRAEASPAAAPADTSPATEAKTVNMTFARNSRAGASPTDAPADASPATEAKKAELVNKIAQLLAQNAPNDKGGKPASAPVPVGGAVKEPARLKYVPPVYPKAALDADVQGTVILEATIGEDGRVRDVKVLRSIRLLDQAAIDAVKQWEYTPTYVNGAAIPVTMAVSITFSL